MEIKKLKDIYEKLVFMIETEPQNAIRMVFSAIHQAGTSRKEMF